GIRYFHVTGVQTCALPISNYGRTPDEQTALQRLLDDALNGFTRAIDQQKTNFTKFVWEDCDDTDDQLTFLAVNPRADVFERIAGDRQSVVQGKSRNLTRDR